MDPRSALAVSKVWAGGAFPLSSPVHAVVPHPQGQRNTPPSPCDCNTRIGEFTRAMDGSGGSGWGTDGTWLYTSFGSQHDVYRLLLLDTVGTQEVLHSGTSVDFVMAVAIDGTNVYWLVDDRATPSSARRVSYYRMPIDLSSGPTLLHADGVLAGDHQGTSLSYNPADGLLYSVRQNGVSGSTYTTELVTIDPTTGAVSTILAHTGSGSTIHFYEYQTLCPTPDGAVWGFAYDNLVVRMFRCYGGVVTFFDCGNRYAFQLIPSGTSSVEIIGGTQANVGTFNTSFAYAESDCPTLIRDHVFAVTCAASPDFSTIVYDLIESSGPTTYGLYQACP